MDNILFTDSEVKASIIYGLTIELAFRKYGDELRKEAEALIKGKSTKELRKLMAVKISNQNLSLVDSLRDEQ